MNQLNSKHFLKVAILLSIAYTIIFSGSSCKKDDECILPIIDSITDYNTGEKTDAIGRSNAYIIHGKNFSGVALVYINSQSIDDWVLNESGTSINFNTPSDISTNDESVTNSDMIVLSKQCGSSAPKYVDILPPNPLITRISNEYAVSGDEIFVSGLYFVDMEKYGFLPQGIYDNVDSFADSTCYLTVPSGVNDAEELVLITSEGDSSINATGVSFHGTTGLICNFDDVSNYDDTDGQIIASTAADGIDNANGNIFLAQSTNIVAGTNDVASMKLPMSFDVSFDDYDGSRSSNLVALEFEMFSTHSWESGYYTFEIGYRNAADSIEFAYQYSFQPEDDDDYADIYIGNWLTYSLPFNRFELKESPGTYVQSFSQLRVVNYVTCTFTNPSASDDGVSIPVLNIAMDNFRIQEISGY